MTHRPDVGPVERLLDTATEDHPDEHPRLKRKVSYQYLLRLEVYKLKKYLLADEPYEPFRRWW